MRTVRKLVLKVPYYSIIFVFSSFRKIISELVVDRFKKRIKHLEEVQYVKISSKVNKQFISPFENCYHSYNLYL